MLLQRLTAYADEHRGDIPPFHREREFRWKVDIPAAGGRITGPPVLEPVRDVDKPARGVVHTVPASTRTVAVAPQLAADDVQYVLGWGDDTTQSARVTQCHAAFVELTREWAATIPVAQDGVPHVLVELYRSGALAKIDRPQEIRAKDGVVLAVNGQFAYRSPSAAGFWKTQVGQRKGSGRSGRCLVCGTCGALANTIPGKVPAALVPGASNDAALVSVNERVFGYDLVAQLTHTPICLSCADDVMVGLTGVLSSKHRLTLEGQDTRLAWWVTDTDESDQMDLVMEPDPAQVDAFFAALPQARERTSRLKGRFCWLAVGGNVARIMVREWIDIALTSKNHNVVDHDSNIVAWFADHKNTPRRTTPVRLRDGRDLPAGQWLHSPVALAACLGRWDETTGRYRPFGARNTDRPEQALNQILRAAVLNEPVPAAMRAHLIHRVRNDGHIDDLRASLVRLALSRRPNKPKGTSVPMSLDETCTETAYLAGRLFAVMEHAQRDAHYKTRRTSQSDSAATESDSDAEQEQNQRREVNSSFGDKFRRRACETPRPILTQGWKDSAAWLTKIRRHQGEALARWHQNRLTDLYEKCDGIRGVPLRSSLTQQEHFILGYHHQLAYRTTKNTAAEA
ncbi:type I-C CRISPR-associated protein Cas8c/Csd1 [Nocardia alni]|uniref:type I-C CRISPR-associated protein Cas8c/Csd1 n=1 Tax=Nocardia alni TaxID=2815723 RepID=UPI001C21D7EC|nr:type I-C CRISPR-associated protein Cas8c/Csd1 [Nocardia alni]